MNINEIDTAVELRNRLRELVRAREAIEKGRLDICAVFNGYEYQPRDHMTDDQSDNIRARLVACANEKRDKIVEKLNNLGVTVPQDEQ